MQDLLAGRGELIALACTGPPRLPELPKIPTIAESDYPGFNATDWYAFVAPSKVPTAVLDRWNAELVKVLKSPAVVAESNKHGLPPQPGTRDALAKEIERESTTWGRVVRDRKITVH